VEAAKRNIHPQEITDRNHAMVVELFRKFNLSFDNYTRTHNHIHMEFVRNTFAKIYDNGYIYEKDIEQLYCRNCERFLPDRFVTGTCPSCGYPMARGDQCEACGRVLDPLDLVEPRCSICGLKPVVEASTHWFFDLPRFSDRLYEWLTSNKALPEKVRNFSLSWIKEGLKPRAVTRDNLWGIPAPFPKAGKKTIYVWFEAVLGYVSATVEWAERRGETELWKKFWLDPDTRTVYFIGKDNIPFHAVILPALLMATHDPYTLPYTISATEYLTFEGRKFSKSQGVGIWLDQAIQLLDADIWRYYLVKIRPEMGDSNFSYEGLQAAVNADLNDSLGNFIHRILTFITNYYGGVVPEPSEMTEEDRSMLEAIERTYTEVRRLFEEIKERQALECVIQLARDGNTYLNRKEPWKQVKTDRAAAATTLYTAAQVVKALALLLAPFTPTSSQQILNLVGEGGLEIDWRGERPWTLRAGTRLERPKPLFQKITDEGLERLKAGVIA